MHAPRIRVQDRHSARLGKPGLPRVTWIDEKYAPQSLLKDFVGVAENNCRRPGFRHAFPQAFCRGQRVDDVLHQESVLFQLANLGVSKLHSGIGVPQNGSDRCDLFQLKKNPGHAHISGVENMIYVFEQLLDLGVQEIVCV